MINVNHPIIFLDIDGPLASQSYMRHVHSHGGNVYKDRIDPLCCNNLQRIIDLTDAHVVISSTWRKHERDMYDLIKFFYDYNIPIIGITPNSSDGWREHEIQTWLEDHYVIHDCYAVIDDDWADLMTLEDHLVAVDGCKGMSGSDAEKVVRILEHFRPSLDAVKDLSSIERLRLFKALKKR